MNLYQTLFGTSKYGEPVGVVPSGTEALKLLSSLKTADDVAKLHEKLRLELSGGEDAVKTLREKHEDLRTEGNKMFNEERYEDALATYREAIERSSLPPSDTRIYTNAALCLSKLKRYEESIVYCKMAQIIESKCFRAVEISMFAYANLGYFAVACDMFPMLVELKSSDASYINQVAARLKSFKQSAEDGNRDEVEEIQTTLQRLITLSNLNEDPSLQENTIIFLLNHMTFFGEHCCHGGRPIHHAGFMRVFKQVPIIKRLCSSQVDLLKLSIRECVVLERMLNLLAYILPKETDNFDGMKDKALRELLTLPGFVDFMNSLGRQLVSGADVLRLLVGSPFHARVMHHLMFELCLRIDDNESLRERFLKDRRPLGDPSWAVHLWPIAFVCSPNPALVAPSVHCHALARLGNLTDECHSWYLNSWRTASQKQLDNDVAITSNMSTIFYLLDKLPASNFHITPVLFWNQATQRCPPIAKTCVNSPAFVFYLQRFCPETMARFGQGHYEHFTMNDTKGMCSILSTLIVAVLNSEEKGGTYLPKLWENEPCYNEAFLLQLCLLSKLFATNRLPPGLATRQRNEISNLLGATLMGLSHASLKFETTVNKLLNKK